MFEKLNYGDRVEKFGVISKIKIDDGNDKEDKRTKVFVKILLQKRRTTET